jgi:hypothetical protein
MTAVTPALVKRRYNKQGERITPFALFIRPVGKLERFTTAATHL